MTQNGIHADFMPALEVIRVDRMRPAADAHLSLAQYNNVQLGEPGPGPATLNMRRVPRVPSTTSTTTPKAAPPTSYAEAEIDVLGSNF